MMKLSQSLDKRADNTDPQDLRILFFIIVVGFVLRVTWACFFPMEPISDSQAYHTFASNIALHGTYGWQENNPTAYWPVGTSAVIAGLYLVFGVEFLPVIIFNILLSTLFIFLMFELGRLWFSHPVGLLAAGLVALWPSLVMQVTVIVSDILFIVLVVTAFVMYERFREKPIWAWVFLGVLIALAAYVRAIALLVPIIWGVLEVLRGNQRVLPALTGSVLSVVVMASVIAPWTYRNYLVFGEFVPISTNLGPTMWMGNNPETKLGYQDVPSQEDMGTSNEAQWSAALREKAVGYIFDNPGLFVQRTLVKMVKLHERETKFVNWNENGIRQVLGDWAITPLKIIATGYWYAVLAGGLIGLGLLFRKDGWTSTLFHPTLVIWLYFTGVHGVTTYSDRYHISNVPMIAVLAAFVLGHLLAQKKTATLGTGTL